MIELVDTKKCFKRVLCPEAGVNILVSNPFSRTFSFIVFSSESRVLKNITTW